MDDHRTWYYEQDGNQTGPLARAELIQFIAQGVIRPTTLVWTEGLTNWEDASRHFEFFPEVPPPTPFGQQAQVGSDGLYVGAPARSFSDAVTACFRKYARFSGRASRSEYWFFFLFLVLMNGVASILDAALFTLDFEDSGPFYTLVTFGLFLPSLAVGWRRLHDTNRSGWWFGGFWLALVVSILLFGLSAVGGAADEAILGLGIVLGLAGLAYAIAMLVFLTRKGQPHPNRFG
jgi:uncharacterized membrane protein YhaH (DUF805 family)